MLPFDKDMKELADAIGGYYRRYCDDILWICDTQHIDLVLKRVDEKLNERGDNLVRKDEKNGKSTFRKNHVGKIIADRRFQYLGFEFDGKRRLIRSQTLARYWRRTIYSVRSAKREAQKAGKEGGNLLVFRKKLNLKQTHLGKGNFVTGYAYRAQNEIGGEGKTIRKQLAGHYDRISEELLKPLKKR